MLVLCGSGTNRKEFFPDYVDISAAPCKNDLAVNDGAETAQTAKCIADACKRSLST
jgi:hypothetical protein